MPELNIFLACKTFTFITIAYYKIHLMYEHEYNNNHNSKKGTLFPSLCVRSIATEVDEGKFWALYVGLIYMYYVLIPFRVSTLSCFIHALAFFFCWRFLDWLRDK